MNERVLNSDHWESGVDFDITTDVGDAIVTGWTYQCFGIINLFGDQYRLIYLPSGRTIIDVKTPLFELQDFTEKLFRKISFKSDGSLSDQAADLIQQFERKCHRTESKVCANIYIGSYNTTITTQREWKKVRKDINTLIFNSLINGSRFNISLDINPKR